MRYAYEPVLDFWFRDLTPAQWFVEGGPKLDPLIRARFGTLLDKARRGECEEWIGAPRGRLALIILLDQFSRHIHRGTSEAFASDATAQRLSREGIDVGIDKVLTFNERQFFYMPLMHSEDRATQRLSCEKFTGLRDEAEQILGFAFDHYTVIERYGRFPHRNATLGRVSTAEEEAFLASGERQFR